MEEMHRARSGERARSFHAVSEHASLPEPSFVPQPRSSLNPVPLGFYGGVITQEQLIKSLASSPYPLPGGPGGEAESSNPLNTIQVLLAAGPHPRVLSKSHHINITKDNFMLSSFRKFQGFKSCVPRMGTKTKYTFLIINHNITTLKIDEFYSM